MKSCHSTSGSWVTCRLLWPSRWDSPAALSCFARAAFQARKGFDERLFWGEEGEFALMLKREGRFVAVWNPVVTSGRRFRKTSALQLAASGVRMIFSPIRMFTERAAVAKIWYDS